MCSSPPQVHRTPSRSPLIPGSRVLSAVPQSEFQRFWDNSNVSRPHTWSPPPRPHSPPERRRRRRWKNATALSPSLSLHCPYSLISPSLRLALPPWCVVSAWENAGLSGCCAPRRRPQVIQRGAAGALGASRWVSPRGSDALQCE